MPRTTESEVRDLYSTHPDGTDANTNAVQFYIAEAESVVDDRLAGVTGFDAADLRRIEALLACHFLAATDPTETEGGIGDERTTFEGADLALDGLGETRFGRRAIAASNGRLADLGRPASTFSFAGASHDSFGGVE